MNRKMILATALTLLPAIAGQASAFDDGRAGAQWNEYVHSQPQPQTATTPRTTARTIVLDDGVNPTTTGVYQIMTDDVHYFIEVRDGKVVVAKKNGEVIPAGQVRLFPDHVVIVDGNGNVVMDADAKGGAARAHAAPRIERFRGSFANAPRTVMAWQADNEPKPPVMVGVRMDKPSRSLLRHLGIEDGKAVLVAGVGEGLPADQAGLKPYDLIVAVDGKPVESEQTLREVLTEKKAKPGDTVTLTVFHAGARKDIAITLAAYDEQKMSEGKWHMVEADDASDNLTWGVPLVPQTAMPAIPGGQRTLDEATRRAMEAAREAELKAREEAAKAMRERLRNNPGGVGITADPMIFMDSRRTQLEEKLTRLEERLSRMEEILQRLLPEGARKPDQPEKPR